MESLLGATADKRTRTLLNRLEQLEFKFPTPPFSDIRYGGPSRLSRLFSEYYMEIHNKTGRQKVNTRETLIPNRSAMIGEGGEFYYRGGTKGFMVTKWNHDQNFANHFYVFRVLDYFSQAMDLFINIIGVEVDIKNEPLEERRLWLKAYIEAERLKRGKSLRLEDVEMKARRTVTEYNPLASVGETRTTYPIFEPQEPSNMFIESKVFINKAKRYLNVLRDDDRVKTLVRTFYEFVFEGSDSKMAKLWPPSRKANWTAARNAHPYFIDELKTAYETKEALKTATENMLAQVEVIIQLKQEEIGRKESIIDQIVKGDTEPFVSGDKDEEMQSLQEKLDSLVF